MRTGRPSHRPQAPKLASITIAEIKSLDLLRLGISKLVRWSNGVEAMIWGGPYALLVGEHVINIIETPANLGGTQQWLLCWSCETKRRRLFLHNGTWACKNCHKVAPSAQLLPPVARAQRELAKYAERAATLPAWRLKRSAHRIPKLIDKLKGMK